MGHAPPRRRPADDTSQEEFRWAADTAIGLVSVLLALSAVCCVWVGITRDDPVLLTLGAACVFGHWAWEGVAPGFSRQGPPGPEPRLPFLERVKLDYAEGRIEIEQLEEDLEYALGGRCPPRLRPQPLTIRRPGDRGVERVDG